MAKDKTYYVCQACGFKSPRWLGKCPDCGQWNTLTEETTSKRSSTAQKSAPVPLSEVKTGTDTRTSTGIEEFDRVLGGGIVAGSVVLVGGDPGIGKSTLLLQLMSGLKGKALYVSGEESAEQIKMRAERLSITDGTPIMILSETALENILDAASDMNPSAIVVDSIQTVFTVQFESAPGSVGQVRECASKLMHYAKQSRVPVFIVGHVTKEGAIAGPRVLEHIVDTVLYFEGERGHPYRIIRTVKNRFGSTNEIGVFEMTGRGLTEIQNPSELFLSGRTANTSGSVVAGSMEGTRPVLVEIQSLVSKTGFGVPRRTSIGLDYQRVNLLVAVLEKAAGLQMGAMDIFTNVVGGLKLDEPAADLAVVLAVASSFREIPVKPDVLVFGEVGLSGEVRAVSQPDTRLKEASKVGFKRAIIPYSNAQRLSAKGLGMEISGVSSVAEALEQAEL